LNIYVVLVKPGIVNKLLSEIVSYS